MSDKKVVDLPELAYRYEVSPDGMHATLKDNYSVLQVHTLLGPNLLVDDASSALFKVHAPATTGGGDGVLGALTWDKAIEKALGGIGGAVAEVVLDRVLGPSPWENEVSSQLKEIISKLDDILDEIRGLRVFIRDEQRAHWRQVLEASLVTKIDNLTSYMAGARAKGTLEGNLKDLFVSETAELQNSLGEISNYRESETKRPLGVPLYAAVQSGLIMLTVAHRVLGLPKETTSSVLHRYVEVFNEWHEELARVLAPQYVANSAETAYLQGYPRRGALDETGVNGPWLQMVDPDREVIVLIAVLEGGLEKPFAVVSWDNVRCRYPSPEYAAASYKNAQFPVPFHFYSTKTIVDRTAPIKTYMLHGHAHAPLKARRMVDQLNVRRTNLLASLEQTHRLQMVQESVLEAGKRISRLAEALR